jgi:beta-lactamase class D
MRINSGLFLIIWLLAFTHQIKEEKFESASTKIIKTEFQEILDSVSAEGSILVYDSKKDIYYSNDFKWAKEAFIPASTYKIPHTLIALETGVVENAETILEWDGQTRGVRNWNQDLSLRDAFHYSCVPCYQEISSRIGVDSMNAYLNKLSYGTMNVDASNLNMFWLEGESSISQFQQVDFLQRFQESKLPIDKRTEEIGKQLMLAYQGDDFKMIAKTGLSLSGVGWYVGYVEKEDNVYYFATNLKMEEDTERSARIEVTKAGLKVLDILK